MNHSLPPPLRALGPGLLLAPLLAAGALLSGCLLSAEGELPDVEVTERDVAIPAAPLEAEGADVPISVTFKQKPARAGLSQKVFSEVHVLSVNLAAKSGVADLSFLKALRITATSPEAMAAGQAAIELARYERRGGPAPGAELTIVSDPPIDVTALWKSKEIVFTLQAIGQMPTMAWTADVGLRFGATLTY